MNHESNTILNRKSVSDWEKWLSTGKIVPVFQPIVSAETGMVYGYEVLGRLEIREGDSCRLESLGSLFNSKLEPSSHESMMNLKRDVDLKIRSIALNEFSNHPDDSGCIFLNVSPSSMIEYLSRSTNEPPYTIQLIQEYGIRPDRIVIEVTEEPMNVSPEILKSVLDLYRDQGYRIAVDDVGSESSNLDRIGLFHPDIIKVDLQMLRRSVFSRNFKEILLTLSRLGESLGSSLLFEGIENQEELYNALNYGSRYMQGYFFSKPELEFQDPDSYSSILKQSLEIFHTRKNQEIEGILKWEDRIQSNLSMLPLSLNQSEGIVELDFGFVRNIEVEFFRLYITDGLGKQVSPNYTRSSEGSIQEDNSYIGKNWSFRPYFFEHIYKLANSKKNWVVSSVYHDIEENVMLKTFSRNLKHDLILFIDVVLS